jgi:predicted  nucleic acid-binding Zn-ribbon protein
MASLRREAQRVRKETALGQLCALLQEESRWKRKRTIAENKLAAVREQITALADTLARKALDNEPTTPVP